VPDGPTSDSARRKKGRGAAVAHKRLCAECGFADQTDREALERYMGYVPSTEAVVDGDLWLWCRICRKVKRGDEAESEGQCRDKCAACFVRIGCRHKVTCGLVVEAELSYRSHPLGEDSVTGIRKMSIVWVKKVYTGTAMEEILSKFSDQSGTADRRREEVRSDHENPSDTGRRSKHVRAPQTFPAAQVPCKRSTPNKRHPRARSTPTAHPWPTPLATVPESNPSIYTIKLKTSP
jgi:hypothetical protein